MSVKIDVAGTRELERAMRKLERLGHQDVIEDALRVAAEPIEAQAKANAERISRSGAESVGTFPAENGEPNALDIGVEHKSEGFFLAFFEMGTGERTTQSGASRGVLPARPWLRPAADENHAAASRAFAERIREEVARVAK